MRFPSRLSFPFAAMMLIGASAQSAPHPATAGTSQAAAGPAQKLTPYIFPDGSGSIGLPPGWTVVRAELGDVTARGPNGEMLRFGLVVPVIDPTSPQASVLMPGGGAPGNFIAVPYSVNAATLFAQGSEQIARKLSMPAPTINIQRMRKLPIEGGKNFMVYGQVDAHDGRGAQALVTQMIVTPPQALGTYQVTVFEITTPPHVMEKDAATIAAIYPSYNRDTQYVLAVANAQSQQSQIQQQQILDDMAQRMDSTDKMTAGMSNLLRGQTVIRNTETGEHMTVSDRLADRLTRETPFLFEVVPESDYIEGIDY